LYTFYSYSLAYNKRELAGKTLTQYAHLLLAWKYSNPTSCSPLPSKRNTQILATFKLNVVLTDPPGLGVDVMRRCTPIYRKFFRYVPEKGSCQKRLPMRYVPQLVSNDAKLNICAWVKREKYALKAHAFSVSSQRSTQQGLTDERC